MYEKQIAYLKRRGIDTTGEIDSLSREDAKERAIETAYYKACLADSTYHGTNHGAKVDFVAFVCKSDAWPQFDAYDFKELDTEVDELIEQTTA